MRMDFYGVVVELRADEPRVLEDLRRDFEYFLAESSGAPAILWELHRRSPPEAERPRGLATFRWRDYAVYDRAGLRRVLYGGAFAGSAESALAVYDYEAKQGRLYCENRELLHELAYLAVLSRAGWELDLRGFHRVHAFGFERESGGGLVLLPSGGGKSVLALELLRRTDLGIVSEDTPLLSRDFRLLAFPLRLGFAPGADLADVPPPLVRDFRRRHYGSKRLVDLEFYRARVRSGLRPRWLFVGRRHGGEPSVEPLSRLAACRALGIGLVVGHGVAQMSEYMIRPSPSELGRLAAVACSRAGMALRLLRGAACYQLTLGPEPEANVGVLIEFLRSQSGTTPAYG